MKIRYLGLILLLLSAFSCTKDKADISKVESSKENSISIEQVAIEPEEKETEEKRLNIVGPIEKWAGITNIRELPEYVYMKVFWESRSRHWPTIEELFEKYDFAYEPNSAENLNTAGYALYEKGQYLDAIALFRYAVLEKPEYPYPHYNLACCAALIIEDMLEMYKGDEASFFISKPTEPYEQLGKKQLYNTTNDIYAFPFFLLNEIFNHLALSCFLDSDYIDKSQLDPDLKVLHSMERYKNFIQHVANDFYWPFYGYFIGINKRGHINCITMLDGRSYKAFDVPSNENNPFFESNYLTGSEEIDIDRIDIDISIEAEPIMFPIWDFYRFRAFGYKPYSGGYQGGEYYNIDKDDVKIFSIGGNFIREEGEGPIYITGSFLAIETVACPIEITWEQIVINEKVLLKRTAAECFIPIKYLKQRSDHE